MAGLALSEFRRIVVKVGSSLLVGQDGELNREWLESLANDIAALLARDHEILIVSSGAIAIGASILDLNKRRARLEDLQAAAAAGQVQLVVAYQEALSRHDTRAAQILLTPDDTENRRRFLNARGTLTKLLERSVIPIINENDTVATEEIRYGDNDRLGARVAQLVMADALILLSDVDGFYTADPGADKNAEHIPVISSISNEMIDMAGAARSEVGSGGMATKVQAARIATHAGCSTVIASGMTLHPLRRLEEGGRHSVFLPSETPAAARKQWLAGILDVRGAITVDAGAVKALQSGSSLLPVGVVSASGEFGRGDAVSIVEPGGTEIGRGLAEYADDEICRLAGCQSEEIESVLGYWGRAVVVHRDQLVMFDDEK